MDPIVQPSLVIGLGGSGIEIVRRFKRRFREMYAETPYVQFFGVDTDSQTVGPKLPPPLDPEEFLWASNFQMQHYVGPHAIDQHPQIRAWWKGYDSVPLKLVSAGAGQRRPVGRLALFVHFDQVQSRLEAAVKRIFEAEVFWQLPDHYRKVVNVYIAASTCGGTGTGMFLDLAYIARRVIERVQSGAEARTRAVLLLPSVFLGTGRVPASISENIQRNAFGALTELDFITSTNQQLGPIAYGQGTKVDRSREPFRSCYLVGNQVEAGAVITDYEQILQRAAVHMQIEIASPLTQTGASIMDNALNVLLTEPSFRGKPRVYSSFNADSLELPSRHVISRWTTLLGGELITRLQNGGGTGEAPDLPVAYGSLRSLLGDSGSNPYMPRVEQYVAAFQDIGTDGRDPADLSRAAAALHEEAVRQIDTNSQLVKTAETNLSDLVGQLRDHLAALVMAGGAERGREMAHQVRAELQKWFGRAQNEVGGTARGQWLQAFQRQLGENRPGLLGLLPGGKGKHVDAQRQLVIDALQMAETEWRAEIRAKVAAVAVRELPAAMVGFENLLDQLRVLSATISTAASDMRAYERREAAEIEARAPGILPELDAAYRAADRPNRMIQLALPGIRTALMQLTPPEPRPVVALVLQQAHQAVLQVAREYLSALAFPADKVAKAAAELSPLAVVTEEWSTLPAARQVQTLRLVGLPTSMAGQRALVSDHLPHAIREEAQVIETGDEERVLLTAQRHGFPLFALKEITECASVFAESDSVQRHLAFTFPEPEARAWSLLPLGSEQSKEVFALALAIDRVRKVGKKYVYFPADSQRLETDLSGPTDDPNAALEEARDTFLRLGLAAEVDRELESRQRREGNRPVRDELMAWIETQDRLQKSGALPSSFTPVLQTVRQYLQSIVG